MGHTEHYEEADGEGPLCRRRGRNQPRGFRAGAGVGEQALLAAVSSPEKTFNAQKDLISKTNGAIYHPLRLVGRDVTGRDEDVYRF